jgi:hypothetical protein
LHGSEYAGQPIIKGGWQIDPRESDGIVVCARQRMNREGSSPSGARIRGAVSKGGGNASLASISNEAGGQGVHREVGSEGFEEKHRAVIEGATL